MPRPVKKKRSPKPAKVKKAATKFRYPDCPIIGIGIVVWKEDKVLLVRRRNPPHQGNWALPGGKQQLGETIFEAAIREAREEAGIDIAPIGIITALDGISRDDKNQIEYHYTLVEVAAEWKAGDLRAADDALEVRWAMPEEIKILCEWPEVERVVRLSMLQRVL